MQGWRGGKGGILQCFPWRWNTQGSVWGQQKSASTMLWFPGKPNLGLWSHISAGFIILAGFGIMNWLLMDAAARSRGLRCSPVQEGCWDHWGGLGAPGLLHPFAQGFLLHPECGILRGLQESVEFLKILFSA